MDRLNKLQRKYEEATPGEWLYESLMQETTEGLESTSRGDSAVLYRRTQTDVIS